MPATQTAAPLQPSGVQAVLLDIEGTTCPVEFVTQTLFPYAREHLKDFLQRQGGEAALSDLINAIDRSYREETQLSRSPSPSERVGYLQMLIDHDRKLPALKELQGMIWEEGYSRGDIKAPLFPEVSTVLTHWRESGIDLAVYSSGSVRAQQLLYRYSFDGDLRHLFSHWFDTTHGVKTNWGSYASIAQLMDKSPQEILFISDSLSELEAARDAGLRAYLSLRGITNSSANPQDTDRQESTVWPSCTSLSEIRLARMHE